MLIRNPFSTEDIVIGTCGILVNGDMGISFKGICTDTRILEPGYIFWALKGKNFDGHDFWKIALDKGAKGLVLEYFPKGMILEEIPKTISIILVKNTLRALGDLARWYKNKKKLKIIGITGSCGKTTTKEMTSTLLSQFFRVVKNEGNYNNLIGVPLTILGIKDRPDWAILELGTSERGEIGRLSEITEPEISLITCIKPAHLEGLKSLEGVLEEKLDLFRKTLPHGTLVYFYDQELLREKVKTFPQNKIAFGTIKGADLRLKEFYSEKGEIKAHIEYKGESYQFSVKLIGRQNLLNLLGAMGISIASGLEMREILEKLPSDLTALIRTKLYESGLYLIIDDTYNANPGSMESALLLLADQSENFGLKIAILGDMKELGEEAIYHHRKIGELAGSVVDFAIFVGEMAPFYVEGFRASQKPFESYASVEEFLENFSLPKERAVILIKGSRAMRMERIVEKLKGEE